MNILLISLWSISNASIGGTERFVVDLASLLSKSCSVTVFSLGYADLNIKKVNVFSLNIIDRLNEHSLLKYLENSGLAEIEFKLKQNYLLDLVIKNAAEQTITPTSTPMCQIEYDNDDYQLTNLQFSFINSEWNSRINFHERNKEDLQVF